MCLEFPLVFDPVAHRYTIGERELPSVTRILASAKIADFSAPWFTDAVKDRGTRVHAAVAADIRNVQTDPALTGYVIGWRQYLEDSGAQVEHSEQAVCDPLVGYAGTLDVIVRERGRLTVLDIKPALYPSVGPQVAAYARCASSLYDRPVFFQRAALVLPGDGSYRREPLTDTTDELTFLAACRLFHWRSAHGCL